MIKGITVTNDGQMIQRLAVSTKVAIGLPPDPEHGRKAPIKLDCFVFLKKAPSAKNEWTIDEKLTKAYGNKCKEFEIILLDDDIEHVFPTKLAWFAASQCKCFGDGETATRRTEEHPDGQPWTPCGKECPDFQNGDCKPSADLRFMLAAFPQLGSVARIHTSSYRSIVQISSSLQQIQTITGGRLTGIRCKLVVRPEKTSYDGADGKRHSTTIYALNLEIQAERIHELMDRMTDHARLFEQTKKMLGTGRVEVVEHDEDRAEEMHQEFYPPVSPVVFPKADEEDTIVDAPREPNMKVACKQCGSKNGHTKDCSSVKPKDEPTICSDCRKLNGHEPTCKYYAAPKTEPKPEPAKAESVKDEAKPSAKRKALFMISAVKEQRKRKPTDKKGEPATGEPYLVLDAVEATEKGDQQGKLYVWDTKFFPHIKGKKDFKLIAEIGAGETGGKTFWSVEHIFECAGVTFVNDDPGQEVKVSEDEESLFGSEA